MKLQRRHWIGALVALAAAGTGAWWSNRRHRPQPVPTEAEAAFWDITLEGPNGETVRVADHRGRPLLVNSWATWCPPCVEELPLLNGFQRSHGPQGWRLLALAVDQPSAVRSFLQKLPIEFPVGMAGLEGTQLSRSLGNGNGGLPFTVFGRDGRILDRKIGKVSEADLADWARRV
jgi:thiol-disulfide isomerase/thioredoxin